MEYLLGFDIGGTKCAAIIGCVDDAGEIGILGKAKIPTTGSPQGIMEQLFTHAEGMMKKLQIEKSDFKACGISCGGPLDSTRGTILSPPNLPGWDEIPITDWATKRFNIPTYLQNDANACACAEWRFGAGKGYRNVVFLTFGTGMGAGLILNGQLYSGTNDLAGEVGHIRLAETGPQGYGKHGSFEGFCSGSGIAHAAKEMALTRGRQGTWPAYCSSEAELPNITAETVAAAADNGDRTAIEIMDNAAKYLGRGIAMIVDFINPEIVIIGSIFNKSAHLLAPKMMSEIEQECLPGAKHRCQIVASALGDSIGDYAALAVATT